MCSHFSFAVLTTLLNNGLVRISQAFQRIKEEKPEMMKRLVAVQGDVTFDGLGLSGEQRERICRETDIVYHFAATLRLEANLKDAIQMNTTGTKRVLDLARDMQHLMAFIHLSTAFCYCDQEILLEKVYDCPHDPNDLIRCTEWMDAKSLEKITADLIKPHPNTYTYSKRLAEILVQSEYPNLPVCIARPSIGKFNILTKTLIAFFFLNILYFIYIVSISSHSFCIRRVFGLLPLSTRLPSFSNKFC